MSHGCSDNTSNGGGAKGTISSAQLLPIVNDRPKQPIAINTRKIRVIVQTGFMSSASFVSLAELT
jgi:hypothetical protein